MRYSGRYMRVLFQVAQPLRTVTAAMALILTKNRILIMKLRYRYSSKDSYLQLKKTLRVSQW